MKKKILALITGGTFDKEYNLITGELFFKDSHLPEMFIRGRSTLDITVRTLMMVDSLEMTDDDRGIIQHHCESAKEKHVIVTHGTDTMVKTAEMLAKSEEIADKTVVLTGAMIHYTFGMSSDGFFNLGSALAFAQSLPSGVYIAMHGEYFNWDNVRKNRSTGYFERINTEKP
jgi:L-asparaginase